MIQFLRLIGSTLGTAVIGAIVSSIFAARLAASIPPATDTRLAAALHDPQALVSPDAQARAQALAQQIGERGPAQLQQILAAGRQALAAGVRSGYWLSFGAAVAVLLLILLLRNLDAVAMTALPKELDESGFAAL
jgi:hypothetical protein